MFQKLGSKLLTGVVGGTGAGLFLASRSGMGPVRLLAESKEDNIYQFSARDIDGKVTDLSKYEGQVCVVVNVASK